MISGRNARHLMNLCDSHTVRFATDTSQYKLKKILLLYKLSRLEIEQCRQPELTAGQLEKEIKKRGIDYRTMIEHHEINKEFQNKVQSCFESFGLQTKAVNRFNYSQSNINWCDVVFPIGGDGTFLFAASRILDNKKPVVGFNSDPCRSEGHLCLPKKYSTNIMSAVRKILEGDFKWMYRTRIRVTFSGDTSRQSPVQLHEPAQRFKLSDMTEEGMKPYRPDLVRPEENRSPFLALNEVFLGEVLTAKVSYFEMRINNSKRSAKVKSSGLCVCTGTGSTSWSMSINRLNRQDIRDIIDLYNKETGRSNCCNVDENLIDYICDSYNQRFKFSPEERKMAYTIRDLISVGVWPYPKGVIEPRSFADRIEVRSKCTDAGLVLDGGITFPFNEGTVAHLETHSEDALRTMVLNE